MKKYLSVFIGSFLILWLLTPIQIAQAHFSETDNSMTVTFHVDPDDSPIPGQPATLYFLFDDAKKKFTLDKCQCVVTVSEQGKQIFSQPLKTIQDSKPSIWGTDLPYIFPRRDVYQINLTGAPIEPKDFQAFDLSWNFRVDQYPNANQTDVLGQSTQEKPQDSPLPSLLAIFLGIPILFGTLIFLIVRFGKE